MRIIAGTARGRRLLTPRTRSIRPTADRVRESIFNVLGQALNGEEVLDLFAGTGALALEALSRGAAKAVLVDRDRESVRLCEANARMLGFGGRVHVLALSVDQALKRLERDGERFDLILADPPYAARVVPKIVGTLGAGALLNPGGILCVEHDKRESAQSTAGRLGKVDERRFGDSVVSIYRVP
jgi:16S rRNA (guanine966-N2)-methyltransferase